MSNLKKTDKFNNMIEAFQCDFSLALEGYDVFKSLRELIEDKDERLLKDIDLLRELSWLLRNGKAEIHLIEEANDETN